jgi:hypothetical protein
MAEGTAQGLFDELKPGWKKQQWRVQRGVRIALFAFLLLALLGVFGSGPISRQSVIATDNDVEIRIDAPRLTRARSEHLVRVRITAPAETSDKLRVVFTDAYSDEITVMSSLPEPDSGGTDADGAVYEYAVDDWSAPVTIDFDVQGDHWGYTRGEIVVSTGGASRTLKFSQFFFP